MVKNKLAHEQSDSIRTTPENGNGKKKFFKKIFT